MSDNEGRIDPLSLFSPMIQAPVRGLAWIGFIQKDIEFCSHTFTLKTLRPSEKAAAAVAVQPWRDTIAEPETWSNALVGMALVAVDGDASFCPPIGPNINEFAKQRLSYITDPNNGWYPPTLGFLYDEYLGMERQSIEATQELQDLSERNRELSPPSPDSLTEQGTSDDATSLDTQP